MTLTTLTAQLENRSNQVRNDIITHGVALLPGELGPADFGVTELKAVGATATEERVQWRPVGRRWGPGQAGSYRYIEVVYRADLTASQEKQVTISQGTSSSLTAFALSANATSKIASESVAFQVNGTTRTIPLDTIVQPANLLTTASTNDRKRRYRYRGRLEAVATTQLNAVAFEVTLDLYSGLDYANIFIKFSYGRVDPGFVNTVGQIALGSGNAWNNHTLTVTTAATFSSTTPCYMMWETKRFHTVSHVGPHVFTLHDPAAPTGTNRNQWGVGRTYRRKGRLFFGSVPAGTNKEMDTRGAAMDFPDKKCAPYGYVPDYPAYVDDRADAVTRLKAFRTTEEAESVDNEPLGTATFYAQNNSPLGGEAGMFGFGSQHCILMLRAGHPAILDVMEREAYQDSLRGGEYFDSTGAPWNHTLFPTAQVFQGKLFYPTGGTYFPDSLGLNNYGTFDQGTNQAIPAAGGNWRGQDREHWCTVGQMHAALVGCDYHMLDQFETYHNSQVIVSNYIDKGLFTGNIPDPSSGRDWGRGSMLAGACTYEVSGDHELLEKCVRDRVRLITEITYNRDGRYYGAPGGSTRGNPPLPEQRFPMTASGFGGWDQQGGGRSSLVMPTPASANHNDKALPDRQADPIWVVGPAAVGAWAAYILLRDTDGATALTDTALRVAADLAGDITREGFLVANAADQNRYRVLFLNRAATSPTHGLDALNVASFVGQTLRGQTSWASGRIVRIGNDADDDVGGTLYRCILRDCNGTLFLDGETVEVLGTGTTSTVHSTRGPVYGLTCVWKKDDASFLTTAEFEEYYVSTTTSYPNSYQGLTVVGRNVGLYLPYGPLLAGGAAIAQYLARNGYYTTVHGDANAEILARATLVLDIMKADADAYTGTTWDGNPSPGFYEYASVAPPLSGPQLPGVPSNLRSTNVTETSITANWDPGSGSPTSFNVKHRELPGGSFVNDGDVPGNTYSKVITGLTADTLYEWTVNATNGNGSSEYATPIEQRTVATPPTPPAPPVNEDTENITTSSFTLTFQQVGDDIDSFQTRYRIVGAGSWTTGPTANHSVGGDTIRVPIDGLVADTNYEAQARSVKGTAVSAYTASATAHTLAVPGDPPGAPTIGEPTFLTAGGFQVNWTPADILEDEFEVNYRVTGVGLYTAVPVPARVSSWSLDGLVANTTYDVYVTARNGNGENDSAIIQVTTLEALVAPTAPDSLDVDNIHPRSSVLHWNLTSTNQTEVFLRYGLTGGSWIDVDPLPAYTTSYAVNNLEPNEEYKFQVAARNPAGDSPWSDEFTWETTQVNRLPLTPSIFGDILDDF